MKYMKKRFVLCGILGWCMEIVFTSARCLVTKDSRLMDTPPCGCFPSTVWPACIYPLNRVLRHFPVWLRGALYSGGILSVEYASGMILKHFSCCPWNYEGAKYNINGVIRLDYAPFWAAAGLIFEKILLAQSGENA